MDKKTIIKVFLVLALIALIPAMSSITAAASVIPEEGAILLNS